MSDASAPRFRMYVPTIGFHFALLEDWKPIFYYESRNTKLGLMLPDLVKKRGQWGYLGWSDQRITMPKGSELKVDRIYIRKGKKAFDSISFWLTKWGEKDEKIVIDGKKKVIRGRFWVKLNDVNNIVFEPCIDFSKL